jgi:hypothetical protein
VRLFLPQLNMFEDILKGRRTEDEYTGCVSHR